MTTCANTECMNRAALVRKVQFAPASVASRPTVTIPLCSDCQDWVENALDVTVAGAGGEALVSLPAFPAW